MAEFGHKSTHGVCGDMTFKMDAWGSGPFYIRTYKKIWCFEDSDRFGPYILDKRTQNPVKNQPGSRSQFWPAWNMWKKSGRKTRNWRGKEFCYWKKPKPGLYWEDNKGVSHFLNDPDIESMGYVRIPHPSPTQTGGAND